MIKYVGLDVHKKTIAIAIADETRDGNVRFYGTISYNMEQLYKVMRKLISDGSKLKCVYEAGPCGYHVYRYLINKGIECKVIAPALIPRKSGERIKNDKRDALSLARLHRSGELTFVHVPKPEDEALRDLVRARADVKKAGRIAKQQLSAFLLRHYFIYSGRSTWSKAHYNWLSDITMPHPAQQVTLQEYIDTVVNCKERVSRIEDQIRNLVPKSPQNELITALQALRGVSFITAVTTVVEIGDFHRFKNPRHIMAFLGLVPSEYSSGQKTRKGSITKTGNSHVRKVLIEAAHAYRYPARKSRLILKRQEKVSNQIKDISWKAQCRLCGRYKRLSGIKNSNVVKVAIARELTGFIWAIAQEIQIAA